MQGAASGGSRLPSAQRAHSFSSVGADELDRVIAAIEALPGVLQAFWNAGTEE